MSRKLTGAAVSIAVLATMVVAGGVPAQAQECKVPNMLIIMDESGSMDDSIGSITKWNAARNSVTTVTNTYGLATSEISIRFGLELFPDGYHCHIFWCDNECKADVVHVGVADNNAVAVQNKMNSEEPGGSTPIGT
ncbi:MAG: hypothetical protein WC889_12785, partial [Myxococcota bacterium]